MKKRLPTAIVLTTVLLAVVVISGCGTIGSRIAQTSEKANLSKTRKHSKSANSVQPRLKMLGNWMLDDPQRWGPTLTLEEARSKLGYKLRIGDVNLAGGQPAIRVMGAAAWIIYPNGVELYVETFPWPDRDPREFYAELVPSQNKLFLDDTSKQATGRPAELNIREATRNVENHPGYAVDKGHNLIAGQGSIDRPSMIVWEQDRIEYRLTGAPMGKNGLSLAELDPIAKSIAKSN